MLQVNKKSSILNGEKNMADYTEYTVKKGDTLTSIARKVTNGKVPWQKIFQANRSTIKNPNSIKVGQVLQIPSPSNDGASPIQNTKVKQGILKNKETGQEIKIGGLLPDPKDPSSPKYVPKFTEDKLPPGVDLRPHLTPIEDQSQTSSCTANATVGAYEYLLKRTYGKSPDLSRLFIYFNARDMDGKANEPCGSHIAYAVKVVQKMGVCIEKTWPFDENQVLVKPDKKSYGEAKDIVVKHGKRLDIRNLHHMRSCLAEGYPIIFALNLFESFQKVGPKGRVLVPDPSSEKATGAHAMLCVGYSDKDKVFIVRNSWGAKWGESGYCYIPYDYFTNPKFAGDGWMIFGLQPKDDKKD